MQEFFFAGISLALSFTMKRPLLGIDFVALTSGWLVPGIALFVCGAVLLILDFLKRKLICPYPFEVLNDFLHGMCQENIFPSKGMSKNQFKFKIKKHGGTYCIDFNLDAPGCSYDELRPHMRRIAEGLGCADTYNFTAQTGRASRYAKGYRYRFEIVLLSLEKAYKRAGV